MADQSRIAHLQGLEAHLRSRIRGQDHVLPRIGAVFSRGALGVSSPSRPLGSLLLVGPTGTGKTETFVCACEYVFGPGRIAVFDMSEYQDKSSINKLLGESRDDPGLLGRALAQLPEGGVLFDEMEKAHALVLDVMLQVLWNGRITVATGKTFQLVNYFVGFTSNIGSVEAMRMEHSKFSSVEQAVLRSVERGLRPELVGRIDEKLVFARLGPEVQREICAIEVAKETSRLRRLGYDLAVTQEAMEFLVREGFRPELGARPLRKTVERQLQNAVVRELFQTGGGTGVVSLDREGQRLSITRQEGATGGSN